MSPEPRQSARPPDDDGPAADALDAYSAAVSAVARELTPRVAALRVRHRRGEGAGSAVAFTGDGFLLTNAHVVGAAAGGQAAFADGSTADFTVVGTDPLSDLAVVRADRAGPRPATRGLRHPQGGGAREGAGGHPP
ncbi:S1C family serine protease, partial [Spirillospora sp. NPDC046719]